MARESIHGREGIGRTGHRGEDPGPSTSTTECSNVPRMESSCPAGLGRYSFLAWFGLGLTWPWVSG